jgi:hypothetical protein
MAPRWVKTREQTPGLFAPNNDLDDWQLLSGGFVHGQSPRAGNARPSVIAVGSSRRRWHKPGPGQVSLLTGKSTGNCADWAISLQFLTSINAAIPITYNQIPYEGKQGILLP